MADANRDLADPDNELRRFYDGAYLYRSSDGDFDINKFNRFYEQYREKRKKAKRKKMIKRLAELNIPEEKIPIYKESVGNMLINFKDSIFNTLDDVLQRKFTLETVTKKNRLFYWGMLLVIIALVMYLYSIFADEPKEDKSMIKILLPEGFVKK